MNDRQGNEQQEIFTVPEAAALLRIGKARLYELIHQGKVSALHVGRTMRIPRAALEEFIGHPLAARGESTSLDLDAFEERIEAAVERGVRTGLAAVIAELLARPREEVRPPIPPALRQAVYDRDGKRCRYCGKNTNRATRLIDHYLPVSLGGTATLENLVVACVLCNRRKGSLHPDDLHTIGMELLPPPEGNPELEP
jgi:excisionase family DNA binding protein